MTDRCEKTANAIQSIQELEELHRQQGETIQALKRALLIRQLLNCPPNCKIGKLYTKWGDRPFSPILLFPRVPLTVRCAVAHRVIPMAYVPVALWDQENRRKWQVRHIPLQDHEYPRMYTREGIEQMKKERKNL